MKTNTKNTLSMAVVLLLLLPLLSVALDEASSQARIMGGREATGTDFAFFGQWDVGCGASLVAHNMFVSAAHCYIPDFNAGGSYGLGKIYLGHVWEQGPSYDVVRVTVHPRFNGDFYAEPEFDFSLLQIATSIPSSIATPVRLNTNTEIPSLTQPWLTVIGFGSLDEEGKENPNTLHQVDLPFISYEECQSYYGQEALISEQVELCTLHPSPQGGADSCFGDSGGPLLWKPDILGTTTTTTTATTATTTTTTTTNSDGDYVQVGIVSWGEGCGRADRPAIASRISAVAQDWMLPNICIVAATASPSSLQDTTTTVSTTPSSVPDFCQGLTTQLPMTLRVEFVWNAAYQDHDVEALMSWKLVQTSPIYQLLYEIDAFGTITDMTGGNANTNDSGNGDGSGVTVTESQTKTSTSRIRGVTKQASQAKQTFFEDRQKNNNKNNKDNANTNDVWGDTDDDFQNTDNNSNLNTDNTGTTATNGDNNGNSQTTFFFDNLEPGNYQFQVVQDMDDPTGLLAKPLKQVQVVAGGSPPQQNNRPQQQSGGGVAPVLEHAIFALDGSTLQGTFELTFEVRSTINIQDIRVPGTIPLMTATNTGTATATGTGTTSEVPPALTTIIEEQQKESTTTTAPTTTPTLLPTTATPIATAPPTTAPITTTPPTATSATDVPPSTTTTTVVDMDHIMNLDTTNSNNDNVDNINGVVVSSAVEPIELIVDVFYDNAPQETSWELRNQEQVVIARIEQDSVQTPGFQTYVYEIPMPEDMDGGSTPTQYEFRMWDTAGDGICCSNDKGRGWAQIWLGQFLIFRFDGIFGSEYSAVLDL